jgi:hypothetical protein
MKRLIFTLGIGLMLIVNIANAQLLTGVNGQPAKEVSYSEVQGNPYLVDSWSDGFVMLDGNQKATAKLKVDIFTGILLFQGKADETLELKTKFSSFTLNTVSNDLSNLKPMTFVLGLPAVDKQNESSFYQQISAGKTSLYKYFKKIIDEQPGTSYTSSSTRRFKLLQSYYVLKNNQLTEIQPGKKTFAKFFEDHAQQYDDFLKANSISFRSDSDLQKLFAWYNSL